MNKVISEFTLQLVLKPEGLNYESDSLLVKRILTVKDHKYSIIPNRKFKSLKLTLAEGPPRLLKQYKGKWPHQWKLSRIFAYILLLISNHTILSHANWDKPALVKFIDHELNSPQGLVQFGKLLKNLLMLIFF